MTVVIVITIFTNHIPMKITPLREGGVKKIVTTGSGYPSNEMRDTGEGGSQKMCDVIYFLEF